MGIEPAISEFSLKETSLEKISLDDKYNLNEGRVFLTGTQAIVRMLMMQQARDKAAGLNTAGFVSGYRGSPLGGLDQQLFKAQKFMKGDAAHAPIIFQPGLNEDLAATACWGAQQAEMRGEGKYDGVFALWYGKGPGVDRSGDVFRHANMAGSAKYGGVLAVSGDDHTAESSTNAHQTEFAFIDAMIPVLSPAGVQEILDYGLYGYGLSRFAGTWAALKGIKDTVESAASVDGRLDRVKINLPQDFIMPEGGLNIRRGELDFLGQEARLHEYKRGAMLAFARANGLNRVVFSGGRAPRIGIITVGKSYLDVREALALLGIDEARAGALGLSLYKIGMPWPLEPEGLKSFVKGLELVLVIEEKRSLLEVQVKEELYGTANAPPVYGKYDESGAWLFPVKGALDCNHIALEIGKRLQAMMPSDEIAARMETIARQQKALEAPYDLPARIPYFCSGCPHNTSTKVPEGARASAGIGCHYMALWMDRATDGFTQMGGEGANWIGEAPFSTRPHIFQNLGDGTYNHSGLMAIRWAVDSKTNMTYKILFNDAVAMTGGQHHEGGLTALQIAAEVRAAGVSRIAIVSENGQHSAGPQWPEGASFHHRDDLDSVQREISEHHGVSVLLYDQTCAAEKRRRRKRGEYPDPDQRIVINQQVCEGCGDCGVQSNCVSVQPVETEFGRKRKIDQTSCNKDFSCVKGFCPSFVTLEGARLKKSVPLDAKKSSNSSPVSAPAPTLPEPQYASLDQAPWAGIIGGVGGTGVVTIGAILAMAAHIAGRGCGLIDMAGLAQKGGAVFSHLRLAANPQAIHAIRVGAGQADLILGADLMVVGAKKMLAAMEAGKTQVIVNTSEFFPGDFTRNIDYSLPATRIRKALEGKAVAGFVTCVDANAVAIKLYGNSVGANMFLLGLAFQKGAVPLPSAAIEQAIRLNGQAIAMNLAAFAAGRDFALAPEKYALPAPLPTQKELSVADIIARRVEVLTAYQNADYAARYEDLLRQIATAETRLFPKSDLLQRAAAQNLFKLMAIKDEYEVARLYSDGSFAKQVASEFETGARMRFHLASPLFARPDPVTGEIRKVTFGAWMMPMFKLLARSKFLRGTALDIFGRSDERRAEIAIREEYIALLTEVASHLRADNFATAVALLSLPEKIKGYGHVKARAMASAASERAQLLIKFHAPVIAQAAE